MDSKLEHDHEYEHSHDHSHPHEYEYEVLGERNKDERTLQILLEHWVDHNKSHEGAFLEWVEKAKALGKEETSDFIEKAIEYMKMADEMLIDARKKM